MGEEHKKLDKLYDLLCDQVDEVAKKGTISATEMDSVYKAVQTMLNITTLKAMKDSGYSNGVDADGNSYGNSYGYYRGNSYGRMHMPRSYSYGDMYPGYSGHSINDRMIACLEELYDKAKTEHERERLRETIDRIRRDQ